MAKKQYGKRTAIGFALALVIIALVWIIAGALLNAVAVDSATRQPNIGLILVIVSAAALLTAGILRLRDCLQTRPRFKVKHDRHNKRSKLV
ncbi:MAG: hypothetical protein WC480_03755 [Patescibacteria group bacterium]